MKRKTAKQILAESFRELAKEKNIDKITVKDITENCGYSTATFYRQFKDKYDLIAWAYTWGVTSIMDRIDMKIVMERVEYDELTEGSAGKNTVSSKDMRMAVEKGICFAEAHGRTVRNADMSDRDTELYCALGSREDRFMSSAYKSLQMSPRSYRKTLRIARTINRTLVTTRSLQIITILILEAYFTVLGTDDSGGYRLSVAEGITDGNDSLSYFETVRITEYCHFNLGECILF